MKMSLALAAATFALPLAWGAGPPGRVAEGQTIARTWVLESARGEEVGPIVVPTELTKDGKVLMVMGFSRRAEREQIGTYRLEGNALAITWRSGGKEVPVRYRITRLTASEMTWSYDGGKKELTFVPFKPLW